VWGKSAFLQHIPARSMVPSFSSIRRRGFVASEKGHHLIINDEPQARHQ
jgi:hypothetical protein